MVGYDVSIECLPICGILDLRGGDDIRRACSENLHIDLPATANNLVCGANGYIACCISSDHWMLQVPDGKQLEVLQSLERSSTGLSHSYIDVSDMYARIQLSGSEAREVLSQGVAIDIHPRVFPAGSTARTGMAKTTVQIYCVDELPTYVIMIFSSYERHVNDWLHKAAAK